MLCHLLRFAFSFFPLQDVHSIFVLQHVTEELFEATFVGDDDERTRCRNRSCLTLTERRKKNIRLAKAYNPERTRNRRSAFRVPGDTSTVPHLYFCKCYTKSDFFAKNLMNSFAKNIQKECPDLIRRPNNKSGLLVLIGDNDKPDDKGGRTRCWKICYSGECLRTSHLYP